MNKLNIFFATFTEKLSDFLLRCFDILIEKVIYIYLVGSTTHRVSSQSEYIDLLYSHKICQMHFFAFMALKITMTPLDLVQARMLLVSRRLLILAWLGNLWPSGVQNTGKGNQWLGNRSSSSPIESFPFLYLFGNIDLVYAFSRLHSILNERFTRIGSIWPIRVLSPSTAN